MQNIENCKSNITEITLIKNSGLDLITSFIPYYSIKKYYCLKF